MIAIVGSGKLTNFLIKNIGNKNYLLISGSKSKNHNTVNVNKNLKDINKLKLPSAVTHCIINWSHTYIKKFSNLKYSIGGFERIADFIINNPNVNYIFISSTSASIEVNKHSLYGLSKFIAENILTKTKELNPNINIRILRPGMIYGLQNCPIKKILSFRRFYIQIYPGNPEVTFPVTSAKDLSKYLLNTKSQIWESPKQLLNFYENIPVNLKYFHEIYDYYNSPKLNLLKFYFDRNSTLINLIILLGIKIDLSLASIKRFPKDKYISSSENKEGIDLYIKNLFKK